MVSKPFQTPCRFDFSAFHAHFAPLKEFIIACSLSPSRAAQSHHSFSVSLDGRPVRTHGGDFYKTGSEFDDGRLWSDISEELVKGGRFARAFGFGKVEWRGVCSLDSAFLFCIVNLEVRLINVLMCR